MNNESLAPMVFNGSCDNKLFNQWVKQFLVKELKPGQIVIMDNAVFHKSQMTGELIEAAGCQLLFLPPYSPDLKPIEKLWANMKRYIKDNITSFTQLYDALTNFFNEPNSN